MSHPGKRIEYLRIVSSWQAAMSHPGSHGEMRLTWQPCLISPVHLLSIITWPCPSSPGQEMDLSIIIMAAWHLLGHQVAMAMLAHGSFGPPDMASLVPQPPKAMPPCRYLSLAPQPASRGRLYGPGFMDQALLPNQHSAWSRPSCMCRWSRLMD